MTMTVRRATPDDVDDCVRIVAALTDFFSAEEPAAVRRDLRQHDSWVITDGDAVLGFLVADRRSSRVAEILWAGVEPGRRGAGIGSRLLEEVLHRLRTDGVEYVGLKTLDGSVPSSPYAATRAFWERRGFVQIDSVDPYPGWRPGNPAAIYVRALR
jgi:ribosomal protein S18 acetylase RimI-like enzyme